MLNRLSLNKLSLNRIDLNRIGGRDVGVSARPYIDPDLLKHVKMAISTWGKTNDDPDRAVLKDLSGNGNDMRLLNFGFARNSGYGLYTQYFSSWSIHGNQTGIIKDSTSVKVVGKLTNKYIVYHTQTVASSVFKIKITGLKYSIEYTYNNSGIKKLTISSDGIYDIPASSAVEGSFSTVGFYFDEKYLDSDWTGFTIEIIPDFEGWLCTDGIDDLIVSVKPVSEMLEGSNEITVVSIIHQISNISDTARASTNNIRSTNDTFGARNLVELQGVGKTGIYGYTCANIKVNSPSLSIVNSILGDKNDYSCSGINFKEVDTLSIQGFINQSDGSIKEVSQIAYAGGFIANKVLTTDEINQVIAYYNLDRPGQIIKPQLYCNIKKQGITNDNHAEFNDQLIDFVNGYNIQLNNIGWEGEGGINSYPVVFGAYKTWDHLRCNDSSNYNFEVSANKLIIHNTINRAIILYKYFRKNGALIKFEIPSFKAKVTGLNTGQSISYFYISENNRIDKTEYVILNDGEYILPKSYPVELGDNTTDSYIGWSAFVGNMENPITIEILPTIENALCLDGISDFGKATGLPILKDYTVVTDRKILGNNEGGTLSKSYSAGNGAFIFETGSVIYSFGTGTSGSGVQSKRMLLYLSKYIYNGSPIQAGTGVDSDSMWLGTLRDGDSRFSKLALWSLMLFPYSLSEFLLERQLRKYKAGTLYPDMIEFRPIVKSNIPYSSISYSVNPGEYIAEGSTVTITITLSNASDKLVGVSSNAISDISVSGDNGVYEITGKVTKSPQKISIVISSYLTMLGNETLISNETLIKNE